MGQTVERLGWTVTDLDLLPQNEGTYYEVIAGELFVTRSPHRRHQQVGGKIFRELDLWSEASGLGEAIPSPGIVFSEADSVIPDVVWVSKERLAEIEDEAGHLNAAPELMVEVLSPGQKNIERDRWVKLQLYSRTGVQEYWIVDRFSQQVEVYRRSESVLTEDFKKQIIAIGGDPATEGKPEDANNQTPLKQIERVLWPLQSGLELTTEPDEITDSNKKQELEKKRKEEISKVQKIVGAVDAKGKADGLYGKNTYDKIKLYLEQQFTDINGGKNTNIDSLETAITPKDTANSKDTAFLAPPPEEPSTFPWRLLWIGGGTLVAVLLFAALFVKVWSVFSQDQDSKDLSGATQQGGPFGSGATTVTQPRTRKRRQKSIAKRQLSGDDYAVLFTAMDHAFKQRNIEIDPSKVRPSLPATNNPLSFSKQEIIKIVKDDLPRSKGGSSLGSHIVQRVVDSQRLNQKISLPNPRLKQEIRNIIQEELRQAGSVQEGNLGGTNQTQQIEVQDQHSHDSSTYQHEEGSPQTQYSPPSLPDLVQQWCYFYNERQNQESGEVAKQFKQIAGELEETEKSYDNRKYGFSVSQDIELKTASKNRGSFWVIIPEGNSQEGWLFPKLKITTAIHKAVQTLFEVQGDLYNYRNIEVIEPAEMMSSDLQMQIWKLRKKGKIRLY